MDLPPETPSRIDDHASVFAGELARTVGEHDLYQLIVDTVAREVGAQLVTLALYDDEQASLGIHATHGYPASLVEHLRIRPGSGVLGRTFESRQPLVVADTDREPGTYPPRLRYRTRSFVAMPLVAGGDAVGVLSATDRSDGHPFDQGNLSTVQALAAPAALALACVRLIKQKLRLEHALARDPLTGLFNRRYFDARVEEEIGRARRQSTDVALLVVDIDEFKSLNDALGHPAGDVVLQGIAATLRRSVRVFDVCARLGGDEFSVLLPGSDASSALQSAGRIRRRVESYRPESLSLKRQVTVSIGLAVMAPETTSQDLMARADRALYRAKADGRNCVRLDHD